MASLCRNPRQNAVFGYIIRSKENNALWLSWIEVFAKWEWRPEHKYACVFYDGKDAQYQAEIHDGELIELIGRTV